MKTWVLSGSGTAQRSGFARMTAEVALGQVGIVLGLEVSRLARNNADWYEAMFAAHGLAYERSDKAFIGLDAPPPYYSNITLQAPNQQALVRKPPVQRQPHSVWPA